MSKKTIHIELKKRNSALSWRSRWKFVHFFFSNLFYISNLRVPGTSLYFYGWHQNKKRDLKMVISEMYPSCINIVKKIRISHDVFFILSLNTWEKKKFQENKIIHFQFTCAEKARSDYKKQPSFVFLKFSHVFTQNLKIYIP